MNEWKLLNWIEYGIFYYGPTMCLENPHYPNTLQIRGVNYKTLMRVMKKAETITNTLILTIKTIEYFQLPKQLLKINLL